MLWVPKRCRHACNILGMLGNVLGRPWHVLQHPRHALQRLWPSSACFCKVLGVPHRRETPPPHLLPYKLWNQGSSVPPSFISGSLVVHYSLNFTVYKAASRRVSLRCETYRTLQKHAKVGQGCCQACLGRCKACRGQPRTLPSMPRALQACLHILSIHNKGINVGS